VVVFAVDDDMVGLVAATLDATGLLETAVDGLVEAGDGDQVLDWSLDLLT
jgi:hypothetical protein